MRIAIFSAALLVLLKCSGQAKLDNADSKKYEQASDYILSHKELFENKSLSLADSLVYIPVMNFFDELNKVHHYSDRNRTLDSLNLLDSKRFFKPIYWNELSRSKFNESNLVLYFSKVYGDQLIAEVIDNAGMTKASYDRITILNNSIVFLFEFDSENRIKKVYSTKINYN